MLPLVDDERNRVTMLTRDERKSPINFIRPTARGECLLFQNCVPAVSTPRNDGVLLPVLRRLIRPCAEDHARTHAELSVRQPVPDTPKSGQFLDRPAPYARLVADVGIEPPRQALIG